MIPLSRVPRELGKLVSNPAAMPTDRRIYNAAVDGRIQTYQAANGRYLIDRSNLSQIIELFGLEKAAA